MPLKNYSTLPPGGWVYEQMREDGATVLSKVKLFVPISDATSHVLKIRVANKLPKATYEEVLADIDNYTCERLGFDPKWCSSGVKKKSISLQNRLEAVGRVASAVTRGASTIFDWLGKGGIPVHQEQADKRSRTCLGCPMNHEGGLTATVAASVAEVILAQRRAKLDLKLEVDREKDLHTCQICLCHLPLKIWVPLNVILERITQEELKQFPAYCWMNTETTPAL